MNTKNIILCFCKHPEVGFVKTRLAKDIGNENAVNIYNSLLKNTLSNVHLSAYKTYLYCYPNMDHPALNKYAGQYNLELRNQSIGNLGDKMFNAIESQISTDRKIILIGTDCPEIDADYIHQAFHQLNQDKDVVLGPTEDGGYALIGANKISKSIFEKINWSTNQVLKQTIDNLTSLGWSYSCLPKVRDLDVLQDFQYFSKHEKYKHLFN